jgi:hypothetical protein
MIVFHAAGGEEVAPEDANQMSRPFRNWISSGSSANASASLTCALQSAEESDTSK